MNILLPDVLGGAIDYWGELLAAMHEYATEACCNMLEVFPIVCIEARVLART